MPEDPVQPDVKKLIRLLITGTATERAKAEAELARLKKAKKTKKP